MRKLKLQMQVTLDGFVAGADGAMDWVLMNWDEPLKAYVTGITEPVDTILLGRVLAEGFIPYWDSAVAGPLPVEGAQKLSETPKVVFSKTLQTSPWKNTKLAHNLIEDITAMKGKPGGDIIAYGGGSFVSGLINEDLIDEYHLFINPVALGSGMPIFNALAGRLKLKLVNTLVSGCGIVVLCYVPEGE